jgi:hypothetical protein
MFLLFPFIIALFTFGLSLFLPMFEAITPLSSMYLLINCLAIIFGVSVGAFALMGREMMNRRFGQVSSIAYSSRSLPVSERSILSNVIMNDIIFYSVLFIIPFFAGLSAASAFTGAMPLFYPLLIASVFLSFLTGISASFFLSTLYIRSAKIFSSAFLIAFLLTAISGYSLNKNVFSLIPSIAFFDNPNVFTLGYSLAAILILSGLSIAFAKIEYNEKVRHVKNSLTGLSLKFDRVFREPDFMAKDMLDLNRSGGGLGKVFFSLLFPLILIWALLYIFSGLFLLTNEAIFLIFSVLVGALSSSMYNWLTEFDDFSYYSFLPVKVSTLIVGKLEGYILLNVSSLIIVIGAAILGNVLSSLYLGLLVFVSISAYTVAVTMLLLGLKSNRIFSGRTFVAYTLMISPVMVFSMMLSMLYPLVLIGLPFVLVPISIAVMKRGFRKWDSQ